MGIGHTPKPPSYADYAGATAPEPEPSSSSQSSGARIYIRRPKLRFLETSIPYVIIVDDNERDTMYEGDTAEMAVRAGRHLVKAMSQNRKDFSDEFEVLARADGSYFLECDAIPRPGPRDPRLLFEIGMPHQPWISLKEVPNFST
jgi:hypothetical protein